MRWPWIAYPSKMTPKGSIQAKPRFDPDVSLLSISLPPLALEPPSEVSFDTGIKGKFSGLSRRVKLFWHLYHWVINNIGVLQVESDEQLRGGLFCIKFSRKQKETFRGIWRVQSQGLNYWIMERFCVHQAYSIIFQGCLCPLQKVGHTYWVSWLGENMDLTADRIGEGGTGF